jgi:hypothetical protein
MVTNTIGQVIIQRTNGLTEISQVPGSFPLHEGDWVQAGVNSLAMLEVAGEMQVVMNESTEFLLLSRWESGTGLTWILRLKEGELWVRSKREPIRFEVETSVGTVAVDETKHRDRALDLMYGIPYGRPEGKPAISVAAMGITEFNILVKPEGGTTLTTIGGLVDFGSAFNTWAVPASTMSSAKRGTPCSKPRKVNIQSVLDWAEKMRPFVEGFGKEEVRP